MIHLLIGSTWRSGGSLLARLFDHHPDVASLPFELRLPMDPALHPALGRRGDRDHVQDFPVLDEALSPDQVLAAVGLDARPKRCLVGRHFRDGRLLAKTRHLEVPAAFDHPLFLTRFRAAVEKERSLAGVYDALFRELFAIWDGGLHGGSLEFAVAHRANGLLADVERFLAEFAESALIVPVRSLRGCLASEKRKVLSQLATGRVARGWRPGDRWLGRVSGRFSEHTIVGWLAAMTRAVILKERLGERVVVLHFEDLVREPEPTLRRLADAVGLRFDPSLLQPTNGGHPWAGNSMFGPVGGVDPDRAAARGALNETEEAVIERTAAPLLAYLESCRGRLLDFADLDRAHLFDYELQSRYYPDREKTALYLATVFERWPERSLWRRLSDAVRRRPNSFYL